MDPNIFRKSPLPSFYYVIKFKEHNDIKNEMLRLIGETESSELGTISCTDWKDNRNVSVGHSGGYSDLFLNTFRKYLDIFTFQYSKIDILGGYGISNCWFQKYENESHHDWHNHPSSDYSFVYFLKLPKGSSPTTFFLPESGEEYTPHDVEEGDVLVAPGFHFHRSPVNRSDEPKISVVFNLCFYNKE